MNIRSAMEEAFQRGEKIKEKILHDVMHSNTMGELMQNEYFLRSLSALMNTKYEIKKAVRSNLKSVLKLFDLPTRDELSTVERKLHRLETEVDGIHRRVAHRASKSHSGAKRASKSAK